MNPIFRFFKKLKETKKRNEAFRKKYKEETGQDFDTKEGYDPNISNHIPY
jgi:hypothetical protein